MAKTRSDLRLERLGARGRCGRSRRRSAVPSVEPEGPVVPLGMDAFLWTTALFLLANLALGLGRVLRGPGKADRMLAAQLFGTVGVAILLLLAEAEAEPALRDVGLLLAVLASVAAVSFLRHQGQR